MIKHKKHYWQQSKNFWELSWIPSLFSKKFENNVSTSHEKVHEDVIIQKEKPLRAKQYIFNYSPGDVL